MLQGYEEMAVKLGDTGAPAEGGGVSFFCWGAWRGTESHFR